MNVWQKKPNKYIFHQALMNCGFTNFNWETLKKCKNQVDLNKSEIEYILLNNSLHPNDYNTFLVCNNGSYIRTPEIKEKCRLKRLGQKASEETKKKMSESKRGSKNHFYGKHHTKETVEILREKSTGKQHSEETKKN